MHGTWSTTMIGSKPAEVYDLPQGTPARSGLLFLHALDEDSLRDHPAFTRHFDALGLVCVCPQGKRTWWADRPCPDFDPHLSAEKYLVQEVVPFFEQRWGLPPRALALLGVSMGGQGALRLAFKHPHLFAVAAALAPTIEYHELYGQGEPLDEMYDSKEQCRQDTVPMHIHPGHYPPHLFFAVDPDDAPWQRGCDRLHEKLVALGIPHECDLTTRGGGHSWQYFYRMADRVMSFLADGLDQQSRRLL